MRALGHALLGLWSLSSLASADAPLTIEHAGVGCVVAERFPRITARLDPADAVRRARVYFRATGTPHWHFVEMRPEAGAFSGVLPKPKKSLKTIDYYVETVDRAFAQRRTPEHHPDVVPPPGACRMEMPMAMALTAAKVVVGAAAGAPSIPLGFEGAGVVATSGAAGAAGAAGASGGGGVSTGLVVAGVVGAGAAVAAVAVAAGGDETATTSVPPTTAAPNAATTTPAPPTTAPAPPTTAPAASLTGRWIGVAPDGMIAQPADCVSEVDLTLELTQSGVSLMGTGTIRVRALSPNRTCTSPMVGDPGAGPLSGTVGPNTVTFLCNFVLAPGDPPNGVNFTGTFTSSRMSGTWISTATSPERGIWSVNRQ